MERVSRDNAALCLIDHQVGLVTGVRDFTVGELKHNVVGLAKAAQLLGLPVMALAPLLTIVNAWDEPAFVEAVKQTGRSHLIFAGVSLQVCAGYPAYSAIDEGYASYVVLDASGVFSPAEREAGVARMTQKGVIMTDYLSVIVEIMRTNADPKAREIYEALDVDFAVLLQQIASAGAAKADAG